MVITTDNLVKIYNTRHVVDGVSISVEQGSVVGLLGPNGAGKTTTFYMIVGIEKPDAGTVMLDGKDISSIPMYERARAGIGYLPQEASIFSKMTVEDNIMAILDTTDLNASEREAKMNALLDEFRLNHVRKSEGKALSGGERRRVEIARALAGPQYMGGIITRNKEILRMPLLVEVFKADFDGYRDERLPEMYKSAAFNGFEVGWEPKVSNYSYEGRI